MRLNHPPMSFILVSKRVLSRTRQAGFTLIEMIAVVVVVGILAAVALPKLVDFSAIAKLASLNALAAALEVEANHVRYLCSVNPTTCDSSFSSMTATMNGQFYWINYGWPDAGDNLNTNQIDAYINYSGFTATITGSSGVWVKFLLNGARDPSNCYVRYDDAFHAPSHVYSISIVSTGC